MGLKGEVLDEGEWEDMLQTKCAREGCGHAWKVHRAMLERAVSVCGVEGCKCMMMVIPQMGVLPLEGEEG